MFNKFTFPHDETNKLFFVADTHFCHDKDFIWKKRGFANVEEHDETIISRWNSQVSHQDNVIHLGDFLVGAGTDAKRKAVELIHRLNGKIHFLWGNHNSGVKDVYKELVKNVLPNSEETTELYPLTYADKFTFYGNNLLVRVRTPKKSYFVFCSHFAHRIWIDSHHGDILHVSGHSHGSDPESQPEFLKVKRLDVGIENFGGPVIFNDIVKVMDKKNLTVIDHHNTETAKSL